MRKIFTTTLAAAAMTAASLFTATQAWAGEGGFCVEVLIGANNSCQHGTYHGRIGSVDGRSTGTGTSKVWVANSNRDRISYEGQCFQPGCTARILNDTWGGFAVVNNNNSFTSRFRGYLRFD